MKTKLYTRSLGGGVVSPAMVGRIDDSKRDAGLAAAKNMIVLPEGIAASRPGTKFVRAAKNADKRARVITFRYSSTQTLAMEFGEAYIRFHSFGQTLLTPTTGVSAWSAVPTYAAGDLVTEGGFTWYAVTAVPVNQQPSTHEYGSGAPVVDYTWQQTYYSDTTAPPGYTYVGTEIPAVVTPGALVYITGTGYTLVQTGFDDFGLPIFVSRPYTFYVGYTATAASGPGGGYWYKMGVVYEIPSPYAELDLADLHYVQSGDVLTLTHPKYNVRELRRNAATNWVLPVVTFGTRLATPTISAVTPTPAGSPSTTQTYSYVATEITEDQTDEGRQSAAVTAVNQLLDTGAVNTITFGVAARRNVYRLSGGLYGFIGQTTTTELIDDNIAPDISRTPPLLQNPFVTDWPAAVTYYQQRRAFAGTTLLPQAIWLTKSGTDINLDYSIPPRDNDAVIVKIAAREASTIRHLVPLGDLIILTSSGEFSLSGSGGVLTSVNVSVPATGYAGASNVQPVVVDNDLIFAAARGGHIRGLGYSFDRQSYVSADLSVRAAHLFDYKTILDMTFTRAPTPTVWSVSSTGELVGLTYVPAEEVRAFHTHETDGMFESVCAVSEGDEDILYCVVKRTINDATVRYIECMAPRFYTRQVDGFFVDCGVTYDGAATDSVTGLGHLEGATVNILADGYVSPAQVVTAGAISLETEASVIQIGLPLRREIETLPVSVENAEAFGQGQVKNVNKVWVRILASGAFKAGPDLTSLFETPAREAEDWGTPADLRSREVEINLQGNWNSEGTVYIVVTDPTPLTVASITKEVEFGG